MSGYVPVHSRFGVLWLHRCPVLDCGPDWVRRERLLVDAGASESRVDFRGESIGFHGHLFRERDGLFRFSDRDRAIYSTDLLNEVERVVNRALT